MNACSSRTRGFTLLELIAALTIMAVLSVGGAMIVSLSTDMGRAARERAELAGAGRHALQVMERELRAALPRSPRVSTAGDTTYLELLRMKNGGRFLRAGENSGVSMAAATGAAATSFDTIARVHPPSGEPATAEHVAAGDILVVGHVPASVTGALHNAYTHGGADCASAATSNCVTAAISGVGAAGTGTRITFASRHFAPTVPEADLVPQYFVMPAQPPVTFACQGGPLDTNGTATGTISVMTNYAVGLAQATPPAGASTAVLANSVQSCTITSYANFDQPGYVEIILTLTRRNESITLLRQVWVPNS